MENCNLYITKTSDNKLKISSFDGVFSRVAYLKNKDEYSNYCQEIADKTINSELGIYDSLSKKDRKFIADKWIKAKDFDECKREYYFNFENIHGLFYKAVKELAESMGIDNYTLEIND